ncbi:glycoside hydrolase family 57 protein [Gloeobacter morelensis]|uniref:DUF1957 domain-containing protein n=1 Tax=Gloeobacter morelensis MG652769 TaxID=2781736 RepID=A0ABY3PPX9_9CYAN|nr:1,4-alpha-glucan branching protein domain-containing protein [Gloeobacter morelensis]UFP95758.1 DUF1957 domain-containing protein [Gloeobacter morelensis MG652769]
MPLGYLALVLHAHLPFVRHPESDYVLEEEWLYEAITETYIPLINMFEGLRADGIDFKLTMSMTPPLVSMLRDPYLQEKFELHLTQLEELTEKELERTKTHGHLNYLAHHYEEFFAAARSTWTRYDGDLVRAFKQFQDSGNLEIITCGATHGYLPLMQMYPQAVWAQLKTAFDHYCESFGREPKGIWLPECAYYTGLERMLADVGLRYFLTDAHGLLYAKPRPRYGAYAPIFTTTGVAAFGRDYESSQQVWSSEVGYPGDPSYREFYKDLGYEAEYEYIKPYIQPNGTRKNVGIKYHKITSRQGDMGGKELYDPYWARERAAEHASNFMFNRGQQIEYLHGVMGRPPIVVSPYDAELFGHWWYEGPWFLNYLFRKSYYDQHTYQMTHLADYLRANPTQQVCHPAQSSWGAKGFHEFWLNDTNAWIYPHLHKATERMIDLARREPADELEWRVLNQAAREVLLAQSSDWAFIMRTGTMVPYAVRRTRSHLLRFNRLFEAIHQGKVDSEWLQKVETVDNIFPSMNYRTYRPL